MNAIKTIGAGFSVLALASCGIAENEAATDEVTPQIKTAMQNYNGEDGVVIRASNGRTVSVEFYESRNVTVANGVRCDFLYAKTSVVGSKMGNQTLFFTKRGECQVEANPAITAFRPQ